MIDRKVEFCKTCGKILELLLPKGIMFAIWTLVSADEFSGIYIELAFLDVILSVGQVCFTFVIFGLEARTVLSPVVYWWRKIFYGADTIVLPEIEELSFETTHVCHQFITHHLKQCEKDLAKDIRSRLIVYKSCFKGSDLIVWLTGKRLTRDSMEAVQYACHLVDGRVLRHIDNQYHFSDSDLLYTFKP